MIKNTIINIKVQKWQIEKCTINNSNNLFTIETTIDDI